MKKLLLVLMIVAMASFLFVGCLGEGIINGTEEEEEEEEVVEQAVTIVIEDQYPADVKEFIRADLLDVTVTFTIAIPADQSVTFQAKEAWTSTPEEGAEVILTPNTARTVWTYTDYDFNNTGAAPLGLGDLDDCTEICLYVTIADCCEADLNEVFTETVKLDDSDPCASFTVTIDDCGVCEDGAEMSWVTTCEDICNIPKDCCGDYCSGLADWSFVLDDDVCDGPCDTEPGNGCPINGAFECGCLLYATAGTVDYVVDVTIKDNVGHVVTDTWTLTFDTDSLVGFVTTGATETDNADGTWSLDYSCTWDDCDDCMP